jgi:hypothetical protein
MRVIAFIENVEVIKKFSNIWVCGMLKGKEATKNQSPTTNCPHRTLGFSPPIL